MELRFKNNRIFAGAEHIVRTLQREGHKAYFVGGCVRDMILGKTPKDIDIVTSALPGKVEQLFPSTHPVGAAFGIITVVENGEPYEVATFREEREYMDGRHPERVTYTDDPRLDAERRDFTINGMFYDPVSTEILDFCGGQDDLSKGILQTIGKPEERFAEDYLRILRAVRFAARFGFTIPQNVKDTIYSFREKLRALSVERIRDELNKMFTDPHPAESLDLLQDLGLLEIVLPEVTALRGVTQPEEFHPEGDVYEHTRLMLTHMSCPSTELAWSILLHDIGKPQTMFVGEDGRERFYAHESEGAVLAEEIMERLRFPRKTINNVAKAVRCHMRFAHVHQMRKAKWKRLMAEDTFPLELELHRIDCLSSNGKLENYILLLDRFHEKKDEKILPEPLLTGRELISLGMKPGPQMGELLKEIADMQLEGDIHTKEDAQQFAKSKI